MLQEYDRLDLTAMAAERGDYLKRKLTALMKTCPVVGDIRGLGLIMAVEMVSNQSTRAKFPHSFASTEKFLEPVRK